MATQTDSLLTDPHPRRHIVYPYNDEVKAVNAVCLFAASGLSKRESVVLIMADERFESITRQLARSGLDLQDLQARHQLECLSADSMLAMFMKSGSLDDALIIDTLNDLIGRAKSSSPVGQVRIFGEMVSLLLAKGAVAVAERLEELWNEVIQAHSISLLCSYTLLGTGHSILPDSLLKLHSDHLV